MVVAAVVGFSLLALGLVGPT
jgi:Tol biopolymer transport system component